MKLIDILLKELPRRGGWPEDSEEMCQSGQDSEIYTGSEILRDFYAGVEAEDCGISNEITKEEYESALAALKLVKWNGQGLPPVGTIVQGLPLDAASFERPFMFTINCIHDGCFIGEAMSGGKVYGELSRWEISPVRSKEEISREEALFDINKLIGDIEKYPTWRHAVCGIYDAIAAGEIRGLRAE